MKKTIMALLLALFLLLLLSTASVPEELLRFDVSVKHEIERSINQGLAFLAGTQKVDGSWSQYPGVTSLVLTAFLRAPEKTRLQYDRNIQTGFNNLLTFTHENGGIYPENEPQLRAYNTSVALMALVAANDPRFKEIITNARDYLISMQADEDEGLTLDSSTYGGIGYNRDERSDISNMQFALEALRASEDYKPKTEYAGIKEYRGEVSRDIAETSNKELFWEKAIIFLQRCQNYKKYNQYGWSSNDGGFVYYPGNSKAGGTTSYGSITYAGMKSLIHAGLTKDDERVQAAYKWISSNYTVEKNPELDRQGLFYYYHVMAKALTVFGDSLLTDTSGANHDWRYDLANKLLTIQQANGSWVNDSGRWWENNPDLVTAYCLMALEEISK
ncbi:MAG: terpene cyclase/mutase family protein [candidate division Zixibacteria bacterium]|nr:terpene cyclase/mutase family protein [candidate division Zixibacteria bacterium]